MIIWRCSQYMKKIEEMNVDKVKKDIKFSKDAVMKSKKFAHDRDILQAMLDADRCYSLREIEEILKKFHK